MPAALSYPGVYIEEVSSGVHTIVGVSTSIAAFIGRTWRGPVNEPTVVDSYADFEREFGGIWYESMVGYAVRDFFLNGGSQAVIVRLFHVDSDASQGVATKRKTASDAAGGAAQRIVESAKAAAQQGAGKPEPTPDDVLKAVLGAAVSEKGDSEKLAAQELVQEAKRIASLSHTEPSRDSVLATITKAVADNKHTYEGKADVVGVLTEIGEAAKTEGNKSNSTMLSVVGAVDVFTPKQAPSADATSALSAVKAAAIAAATSRPVNAQDVLDAVSTAMDSAKTIAADAAAPLEVPNASFSLHTADVGKSLVLETASPGIWGNEVWIRVEINNSPSMADIARDLGVLPTDLFDLLVWDTGTNESEAFRNLTVSDSARRIDKVLEHQSNLLRVVGSLPGKVPSSFPGQSPGDGETIWDRNDGSGNIPKVPKFFGPPKTYATGDTELKIDDFTGKGFDASRQGLYALRKADLFNILCIPPLRRGATLQSDLVDSAIRLCEEKRAMLLVDPPHDWSSKDVVTRDFNSGNVAKSVGSAHKNAALFFPRLIQADPERGGQLDTFVPCGTVAGIFARTDASRGVWKAPAGLEATLFGISSLSVPLDNLQNGELNKLGVNCLRTMPAAGPVVWGARTRVGNDDLASEWKYIPVRRTTLFIEESLYRGTQWVVFEPNDEPLWAQIRLSVGAFMNNLFRQGAFQGRTPREAYFVKCDKVTTTQNDINLGVVNIEVGFAPLKPAEFVVLKIQQIAGDIQT